jgi:large exoprotein involved in heme utilization and adhesion
VITDFGQINAGTFASSEGGDGGDITIDADRITISEAGWIYTDTWGSGKGGNVVVRVTGALEIHSDHFTGISADSQWDNVTGDAGDVTIEAGSITIGGTGQISSEALSFGNGGNVTINVAGKLAIGGHPDEYYFTGVTVNTYSALDGGDAGQITINADSITLARGGGIESGTQGSGNAGNIVIDVAHALEIDATPGPPTGILADSSFEATGDAGSITIDAGTVTIDGTGGVSSSASGSGKAGDISISADNVTLAGDSSISSATGGSGNGGSITIDAADALVITGSGDINASTFSSSDGGDGGQITISADSITLADGGSIFSETWGSGDGGKVVVRATGALEIHSNYFTGITADSQWDGATGDAGDITIEAGSITIGGTGQISSEALSFGNGGNITIDVAGALTIIGNPNEHYFAGVTSNTYSASDGGDAGQITINANSISIANVGGIESQTWGSGNAGNIVIDTQALEIYGTPGRFTGIQADSFSEATGDGGSITIDAGTVKIDGTGQITTSTDRSGRAGDVTISADKVALADSAQISSTTTGSGNSGSITVDAADALVITGRSSSISAGTFSSSSPDGGSDGGDAGQITVTANSLTLADGGSIRSETWGAGNGGNIVVDVAGALEITGDPNSFSFTGTGIVASAFVIYGFGGGDAGQITVSADRIAIANGGSIQSSTEGPGNGGDIVVEATQALEIHGIPDDPYRRTGVFADTGFSVDSPGYSPNPEAGDAGNITIDAGRVTIDGAGYIQSGTFGSGNGGSVTVNVDGALVITGDPDAANFPSGISFPTGIFAGTYAPEWGWVAGGDGGEVNVNAESITLTDGAQISSSTFGAGNGGNVAVQATTVLEIHGIRNAQDATGISAESLAGATGNAGTITIETGNLAINGPGQVTTSTAGPGTAGDVTVDAENIALTDGGAIFSNTTGSGDGGNVIVDVTGTLAITGDADSELFTGIAAESLDGSTGNAGKVTVGAGSVTLAGTGQITTSTDGPGSAGDVAVNGDSVTIADGAQISSGTSGSGNGGNIILDVTGALEIDGGGKPEDATGIVADGGTGNAGTITIHAGNVAIEAAGLVSSSTVGSGSGGDIALNADSLTLTQKGQITTNSSGSGVAGDIVIKAQQVIVDDSTISSDSSGKGASGSVTIDPTSIAITNGSTVSAQATGGGASGGVTLVADVITIEGSTVSTESKSGGGGSITITAPVLLQIIDGVVTATVKIGDQNAGNVTIEAGLLILDGSVLSANAFEGNGGNLTITAKGLITSSDSVLTASSEQGIDGLIDVSTLSDDVTSGLVELSGVLVQDVSRLACTVAPSSPQDPFSSVIVHGRGEYDFDPDAPGFASYSLALSPQERTVASRNGQSNSAQVSCDR